ncbi:putative cyclic nucleotide-binding domain, rmlC-like jelly roll [Helianthus annuus]|nr:putative cyclic nucleotide-binding domain, rmlC-like jelly roll [Helianthus annuus]
MGFVAKPETLPDSTLNVMIWLCINSSKNWNFQWLLGNSYMFGEIGVFFNIPQPFTVRSKKLSQVVRICHLRFKQLVQSLDEDKKRIMINFTQYLKELKEMQDEMPFLAELLLDLNTELLGK